jgi:hypothetical protein
MDTIRRETTAGVLSSANSTMTIRHTIDAKNLSKPNRHLVALNRTPYDVAGKPLPITVHLVITRAKGAEDDHVTEQVVALCTWLTQNTAAAAKLMLLGGN